MRPGVEALAYNIGIAVCILNGRKQKTKLIYNWEFANLVFKITCIK